jgi:hypothetical protein
MILLDAENSLLNLKGQPVGIAVRRSVSILKSQKTDIFVAIKDFISCFAANPKLAANNGHLLAIEELGHQSETFVHTITLFPRHLGPSPNALMCNLCVRKLIVQIPILNWSRAVYSC